MKMTGVVTEIEKGVQEDQHGREYECLRVTIANGRRVEAMIEVPVREGRTYYVGRRVTVVAEPR